MKRTPLHLLVAATALFALSACGSKEPASNGGTASATTTGEAHHTATDHKLAELTVDEVEARIAKNDGKTFVYDDNHDEMYAAGHVPGAKHLAIDNIPPSAFPADKEATLIFYCANDH